LLDKLQKYKLPHFYKDFLPEFYVNILSKKEMVAEKITATIGRNHEIILMKMKKKNSPILLIKRYNLLSRTHKKPYIQQQLHNPQW